MSIDPPFPFSLTPPPFSDVAFDVDSIPDNDYYPDLSSLFPITGSHQLCVPVNPIPDSSLLLCQTKYPLHEHQAYDHSNASALVSSRVTHIPTPHNPNPSIFQIVSDASPTQKNYTPPTPSTLGWDGTHRDDWHMTSCSDRELLFRPVGQDTPDFGAHFHADPSAFPSFAPSVLPYALYSDNQSIPHSHNVPLYQPFISSSRRRDILYTSRQRSTGTSYHRRPARAIEYGDLWVDEAGLIRGLTEPSGSIGVHQCRWGEDRSPCHLWVTDDKSSINLHIQKWHGGKPGGEKLKTGCHWSGCGMTMKKESIPRHIVSIHLDKMWKCQGCGKESARNDAYKRHTKRSNFEACRNLDPLITCSADGWVVNARAALEGGGRLRYADRRDE